MNFLNIIARKAFLNSGVKYWDYERHDFLNKINVHGLEKISESFDDKAINHLNAILERIIPH